MDLKLNSRKYYIVFVIFFKVSVSNVLITEFRFTLDKQEKTFYNNGFKESMS